MNETIILIEAEMNVVTKISLQRYIERVSVSL